MAIFKAAVRLKNGTRQIYHVEDVSSWSEAREALLQEVAEVANILVLLPAEEFAPLSLETRPPLVA
jgi:hypothetical protein